MAKCSRSTHIQLGWSLESNQVPAFNLDSTLAEFWAPIFNLYSTHSSHSTTIQLLKLTIFPFQQLKFNYLDEIGWNSTETQLSFNWVSTKLFCLRDHDPNCRRPKTSILLDRNELVAQRHVYSAVQCRLQCHTGIVAVLDRLVQALDDSIYWWECSLHVQDWADSAFINHYALVFSSCHNDV